MDSLELTFATLIAKKDVHEMKMEHEYLSFCTMTVGTTPYTRFNGLMNFVFWSDLHFSVYGLLVYPFFGI